MQKALTQMNLQLANVISDLSGVTGQRIVRAILAGERDPRKLAELSHWRIQASKEDIAKSLEGNWRAELLFVLQQEVEMYDIYQQRISECDYQFQKHLAHFESIAFPQPKQKEFKTKKGRRNKNTPQFNLRDELEQACHFRGAFQTITEAVTPYRSLGRSPSGRILKHVPISEANYDSAGEDRGGSPRGRLSPASG
jgi:hypothetical protein